MCQFTLVLGTCITTIFFLFNQSLLAETISIPAPSDVPLELDVLTKSRDSTITANTIHQGKLTVPSLWWFRETSENKLMDNWIVYPSTDHQLARVDVIVNQQVWSLLDYLERYDFVNRLGEVARSYGYNVRIFNYQEERLATYTCNFSVNPSSCKIEMNSHIKFGLGNSL